jgi:hypothetical protein
MLGVAFVAFMTGGTFLDIAYHELLYQVIAMVIISKAVLRWEIRPTVEANHQVVLSSARSAVYEQRLQQRESSDEKR